MSLLTIIQNFLGYDIDKDIGIIHTSFENKVISPNFYYNIPVWKKVNEESLNKCPFHIMSKK